ncbi:IS1182 family transposase, partial [Streptococcus sp. HMSC10E12]
LKIAFENNLINTEQIFIDSTHIKANANKNKYIKKVVQIEAKAYQKELDDEVNLLRKADGKKPIKKKKEAKTKYIKESKTDPESGYYVKSEREKQFAYSLHACVDRHGFILDSHVTPGNIHDSTQLKPMIERMEKAGLKARYVAVDSGYKTPANAHYLIEKLMIPVMPYTRPKGKEGFFKIRDFIYDEYYDSYICPNDEFLTYKRTMPTGHRLYMSNSDTCRECPLLNKCTENKQCQKQIQRHVWQDDLDIVEDLRFMDSIKKIYKMRSQTIERRFGDAKEQHGMRWTRFRSLGKVTMDTMFTCAAMNLKKVSMWLT